MATLSLSDRAIYKRILTSYKPYLWMLGIGIVATIAMSGVDSLFAYSIKLIGDAVQKMIAAQGAMQHNSAALGWLSSHVKGIAAPHNVHSIGKVSTATFLKWLPLGVVVIAFARVFASIGSRYYMNRVARSVVRDYRRQLFAKLLKLPARYYDHHSSGHILSTLLYNTDQIVQAGVDVLVNFLQDGTAVVGLIIVLFLVSWKLTLLVMLAGPPIVLVAGWASRRMRGISKNVQQLMGDTTHIAEEGIKNYKMIRIYGGEAYEYDKFEKTTERNLKRQLKITLISALSSGSMQIFIAVPLAIIFYFFHSIIMTVSVGSIFAFIVSMVMLIKPLRRVVNLNSQIQRGIAGAEGVLEILDQTPEVDAGHQKITQAKGLIEYRDVGFQYHKSDHHALSGVSFKIKPGQTVAIVGRSGSGKTTIANLLPRFYEPQSGQILLDDVDLQAYRLSDLRSQLSLVSQNVTLFNDTIANNIAYGGCAGASEAAIIAAAQAANAMPFIQQLPEGIHTLVGENGVLLSGGQRQRIAIARALLKKAPILILDEATSALDTETERHIQAALDELMAQCTALVIAHRLSTIENADWIVVMDEGRIVEQGTHQTLLAAGQTYATLYQMQFRETEPEVA